jgi:4-hydroxybenzoate polyprenyltransferase
MNVSETIGRMESGETPASPPNFPICVDLDGTLVQTDTILEGLFALGASWCLVQALLKLPSGRAVFKSFVAQRTVLNPALLPYNESLLAWLRTQQAQGRRLILTTGADRKVAAAVASHLALFDEVIASDGVNNNKATAKAEILVRRYGHGGFTYVGNSRSDLPIWQVAATGVVVNAGTSVAAAAHRLVPIEASFNDRPAPLRTAWDALRPYQWVKNLLVFVPIVTAHATGVASDWLAAAGAFIAFCATASAIYLLNDLSDLVSDRSHPRKRLRPIASGALPVPTVLLLVAILLALGFAFAALSSMLVVICMYAALSLAYSIKLKELPLVDLFVLAALYTLRLIGGGEATGHFVSLWLLAFSGFLFLSLASLKRVAELIDIEATGGRLLRRGYETKDAAILTTFGCCASFASCIVLALFVQEQAKLNQYDSPELLWGIVPLILFWQCRLWLSTVRGYMQDDPIVYASGDWVSWIVAILVLMILAAAAASS